MELAVYRSGAPHNQEGQEIQKLVLLHGMGGTGRLWRGLTVTLENCLEILAPDQRGHGLSRVPSTGGLRARPGYSPLEYGQDVIDTIGAQGFFPTWILGHSMGVRSACAAAHLKPDWVKGLILVDLGFSGLAGGGLGEGLAQMIRVLPERFLNRSSAREFLNANCPDPSISQYLLAVAETDPTSGELTFPFDHGALIETINAARDVSVRHWVKELALTRSMPIWVLRGAQSLVWSKQDFEAEKREFQDCKSVVFEEMAGSGHGLPFEKRRELADRIIQWTTEPRAATQRGRLD